MDHIWEYIDGQLPPEEAAALKKQIEQDPDLQAAWRARYQLDRALAQMEPEQPSMRFAKNVMEKLPDLYGSLRPKPLVPKVAVRAFWACFSLALAGLALASNSLYGTSRVAPLLNQASTWSQSVPFQIWAIVAAVCTAFVFFYFLDKQLNKRFSPTT